MPTPTFQPPQGQQDTAQLQDWIIKLVRDLNYLLGNLDTVNVNRLDANVIIANTITAGKMNVSQLSAIAADLGTITAGIIYGAYIATANGTYPRTEFSSSGNLLAAYFDATHYVSIIPNLSGSPAYKLTTPTVSGYLAVGAAVTLQATGELDIGSSTDIFISATNLIHIVGGWVRLKNEVTGVNLQTELDSKPTNVIKQGSGVSGVETTYAGMFYSTLVINYSGFTTPPKVHAYNTATLTAWVSAVTPISTTSATIYLTSTVTGQVASKNIEWTAIGT